MFYRTGVALAALYAAIRIVGSLVFNVSVRVAVKRQMAEHEESIHPSHEESVP